MNKIWATVTIARQFDGEMISIKFGNCYTKKELADAEVKRTSKTSTETIDVPGIGPVQFFCEQGVHELNIVE